MFEKLITTVLNKVLGDFIENIDDKQLDISVFSGNVSLTNMKLKASLFDSLPVPFSLEYGIIGTINLKIPVLNILSQPVIIEIKDVLAVIRPKHMNEWSEEVEQKAFKKANQSALEQFEVFSQGTEIVKKKDSSSMERMVTKIVENLQITVQNIYIRYEDSYSAPRQGKFVIGLLLKEFSALSTAADWKTKIMSSGEDITHKVAKIKNFTIFMDYDTGLNHPTEN